LKLTKKERVLTKRLGKESGKRSEYVRERTERNGASETFNPGDRHPYSTALATNWSGANKGNNNKKK